MSFSIESSSSSYCADISVDSLHRDSIVTVDIYHHVHRDENQRFRLENGLIIPLLDETKCWGFLGTERDCLQVILVDRNGPYAVPFKRDGEKIRLARLPEFVLTCSRDDKLVLQSRADEGRQKWIFKPFNEDDCAKPACSCHLKFGPVCEGELRDRWTLENTVNVLESTDCTYFCVVGWGPGGYSGLQQWEDGRRGAIFSMWDDGEGNSVEEVDSGEGVKVTSFGGEGTGRKSMREFAWKVDEDVTFEVSGKREGTSCDGRETWVCSCWFVAGGQRHFMASFRRSSKRKPLNASGFYSFVEDYDRCSGAQGHERSRKAIFSNPRLNAKCLPRARFTKVEEGLDKFGKDKAVGVRIGEASYLLSTGGCDESEIVNNSTNL